MKRLLLLAAFLLTSHASASDNPADWKISGSIRHGTAQGNVILNIAGKDVASTRLVDQTALGTNYQGRDVSVRCVPLHASPLLACGVLVDGKLLKTLYYDSRLLR